MYKAFKITMGVLTALAVAYVAYYATLIAVIAWAIDQ